MFYALVVGATRCIISFFNGDFSTSFLYNPFMFILIIYLFLLNVLYIINTILNKKYLTIFYPKWYYVVIYSSGLMGISDTYYEAAKVDGAGTFQKFWKITLPMLKPTIILAVFLSITSSLQCFDLIFTMTGGGPNNASTTLVVYSYSLCFGSSSAGYAMSISNVLFIVILIIAMMQRGMIKREASEI